MGIAAQTSRRAPPPTGTAQPYLFTNLDATGY
jgi:hypothetical protein